MNKTKKKKSSRKKNSSKKKSRPVKNIILYSIIVIILCLLVYDKNLLKSLPEYNLPQISSSFFQKKKSVEIELPKPSLKTNLSGDRIPKKEKKSETKPKTEHTVSLQKATSEVEKKDFDNSSPKKKSENSTAKILDKKSTKDYLKGIKDLYIPDFKPEQSSQTLHYTGFSLSYNNNTKIANWVGYELTADETVSKVKRVNKFVKDPNVMNSATNKDYLKSGYDRGHLAPAADMGWSEKSMFESFYYSNMTPQEPSFNRGIWKELEEKCRNWAQRDSAIIIVTGPIVSGEEKKLGNTGIVIPNYFFKAILSPFSEKPHSIGFVIKNEGSLKQLKEFSITIDSLETLTGFDFFQQLPDNIENQIESEYDLNYWF